MSAATLRLGTRRSALARTQSALVATAITQRTGTAVELVEVLTPGDVSTAPLRTIGGTGVFTSALRTALLDGAVDLAVHSLKDLPTAPAPGLALAAVPEREDPRDVLVAAGGARLADLRPGARVGTGSPRRAAQLRALRPDLRVVDVRGNVDTRLRLVADGVVDAVLLARAGLLRLGRAQEATEVLDAAALVPAPGQGALAVECRAGDEATAAACAAVDHPASRLAVTAERALLGALEAGCTAPVGALAHLGEHGLALRAVVAAPDGTRRLERAMTTAGASPQAATRLGRDVAGALLAAGAADLVSAATLTAGGPDAAGAVASLPAASAPLRRADAAGAPDRPPDPSPPPHHEHRQPSPHAPGTTQPTDDQDDTAVSAPPERVHP